MSSPDVDIAVDLTAKLNEAHSTSPFSRVPCRIEYAHESNIDYKSFRDTQIQVSPQGIDHIRSAREYWSEDARIQVEFAGKTKDTNNASIRDWLDFVYQVIGQIKTLKPLRKKALRIESEERYDRAMLHTSKVFKTIYIITYSQI
jgi:hypothetical protein